MCTKQFTAAARLSLGATVIVLLTGCSVSGSSAAAGAPGGTALAVVMPALLGTAWLLGRRSTGHGAAAASQRVIAVEAAGQGTGWDGDTADRVSCARGPEWRRCPFRSPADDGTPALSRGRAAPHLGGHRSLAGPPGTSRRIGDASSGETSTAATAAAVLQLLTTDAVQTAFQPIVSMADGRLLGVEALSRFCAPLGQDRTPEKWFTDATAVGLGVDLELHSTLLALREATALPEDIYVSVNLSPETLLWPGLPELLTGTPIQPARLVVEITEHSPVQDYDGLARALRPLREAGIRLAVDDAGAGYACFRHILCLSPDVIKLDRTLISGIDTDPARRALAAAVVAFARDMAATVIAEGIERSAELAAVLSLAVDAGQGYLLGRPSAVRSDWRAWRRKDCLHDLATAIAAGGS